MSEFSKAENIAYVTISGDYGTGVLTFSPMLLSEKQWDTISEINENDRFDYVRAVMDGKEEEWLSSR